MIDIEKQLKHLHYQVVNLEKYEYLTGADLGFNPDVIQKAKS